LYIDDIYDLHSLLLPKFVYLCMSMLQDTSLYKMIEVVTRTFYCTSCYETVFFFKQTDHYKIFINCLFRLQVLIPYKELFSLIM